MKIYLQIITFLFTFSAFGADFEYIKEANKASGKTYVLSKEEAKTLAVEPLILKDDEIMYPQYDGEHFFIDKEGLANPNADTQPSKFKIEQAIAKSNNVINLKNIDELFRGLALTSMRSLPMVIKLDLGTIKYNIVILSLTFKNNSTIAEIGIITNESPFKNRQGEAEKIYLGASNLEIKKGGMLNGNVALISPREISLFELNGVADFNLSVGTAVCFNCVGGQKLKFILAGNLAFKENFAKAVDYDNIEKEQAKMFFATTIDTDWDVQIGLKLPLTYGIKFKDIPDLTFWNLTDATQAGSNTICDPLVITDGNVVLDLSDELSPNIVGLPLKTPNKPNDITFNKGIVFKNMKVLLPTQIKVDGTSKRVEIDVKYLAITETGLLGYVGYNNIDGKNAKIDKGYNLKITNVEIEFWKSEIRQFAITGDLRLPIFEENDYSLKFSLGIKKGAIISSGDLGKSIFFGAGLKSAGELITVNIFGPSLKAKVCGVYAGLGVASSTNTTEINSKDGPTQKVGDNWDFKDLVISIDKGVFQFGGNVNNAFKAKQFSFNKIAVKSTFPYLSSFELYAGNGYKDCSVMKAKIENPEKLAGFRFSTTIGGFEAPTAASDTFAIKAIASIELGFTQKEGEAAIVSSKKLINLKAGGSFRIKGRLDETTDKSLYIFEDVILDGIAVSCTTKAFDFGASVAILNGDTFMGINIEGGFEGAASLSVNVPGKGKVGGAGAKAMFFTPKEGSTYAQYGSAWAVDAKIIIGSSTLSGSGNLITTSSASQSTFTVKSITGGAYKNLELNGGNSSVPSGMGYFYAPESWGFKIGADMVINAIPLNLMIMAQGVKGKGLSWIKAIGYAQFPVDQFKTLGSLGDKMGEKVNNLTKKINDIAGSNFSGGATKDEENKNPDLKPTNNTMIDAASAGIEQVSTKIEAGETRIGAGAVVTLCLNSNGSQTGNDDYENDQMEGEGGYFSIFLKPDIQVQMSNLKNASLNSTGYGLLYLSKTAKYLFLGKPSDRLGLKFEASLTDPDRKKNPLSLNFGASVGAYLMLGNQTPTEMPAPLIPGELQTEFDLIKNQLIDKNGNGLQKTYASTELNTVKEGDGIALGMAIGAEISLSVAYVLSAEVSAGIGMDALVVKRNECGWASNDGGQFWNAQAQFYGFAKVGINIVGIDLAAFSTGFLLNGSMPDPVVANGIFVAKLKIWKSSSDFKIVTTIGDDSRRDCISPLTLTPKDIYVEMIEDFTPKDGDEFVATDNMYLQNFRPEDQLKGATRLNGLFQAIKYRIVNDDTNEEISIGFIDNIKAFDPNQSDIVPFSPVLNNGKSFIKGGNYTINLTTKIYQGDASNGAYSERIDNNNYIFQSTEEFKFKISQSDFKIDEKSVLLYPAKNQYNTYKNDYGGNGYFKINNLVASKLNQICTAGCDFYIKIIDNGVEMLNQKISLTDLNGTSFPISNLPLNKTYEIRLTGGFTGGTQEIMLKNHFFRLTNLETFQDNIDSYNDSENQSVIYDAANLALNLNYTGSPLVDFSNEEKEKLVNFKVDTRVSWFNEFKTAFRGINGVGDYQFPDPIPVTLNQAEFKFLNNGATNVFTGTSSSNKPSLNYAPYETAVFDFIKRAKDNNLGIGEGDGNVLIPYVEAQKNQCVLVDYDIRKLQYYKDRSSWANLSNDFGIYTAAQQICFKTGSTIDFNNIDKIKKTIEISCQRGKLDTDPSIFTMVLKRDNKVIELPKSLAIEFLNLQNDNTTRILSGILNFNLEKNNQDFTVNERSSYYKCPTNTNFSVKTNGLDNYIYQFEVITKPREIIKPCITFADVTEQESEKTCMSYCVESESQTAEQCKENCKGQTATPGQRYIIIKSYADEDIKNSQSLESTLTVSFVGQTFTATILPNETESKPILVNLSVTEIENLKIAENTSLYKCGFNEVSVNYLSKLLAFEFVGKGSSITTACSNRTASTAFSLSSIADLNINTTVLVQNNTTMLSPKTPAGFYTYLDDSNIKRYLQINDYGTLVDKGVCGVNKPTLCISPISNTGKNGIKCQFYADANKLEPYTPNGLPAGGVVITFANNKSLTIYNGSIPQGGFFGGDFGDVIAIANVSPSNLIDICLPPVENCPNKPATPIISATTTTAKFGELVTITPSGCNGNYEWSDKTTSLDYKQVITKESSFSVSCIENGCASDKAGIVIGIEKLEIKTANSKDYACSGSPQTLTLEGCAGTYQWTTTQSGVNLNNTKSNIVNIIDVTNYTATCTESNGASSTATFTLNYYESPTASTISLDPSQAGIISGNTIKVCVGDAVKFNATACTTAGSFLRWSNGTENVNTITVNPTLNTTYSVVCKSNFCESSTNSQFDVIVPIVKKAIISSPIAVSSNLPMNSNTTCLNKEFTLTETACLSSNAIEWFENGIKLAQTSNTIRVSKSEIGSFDYSVKCVQEIGSSSNPKKCEGLISDKITITVIENLPSLTLSAVKTAICSGEKTQISVTGSCLGIIEWITPEYSVYTSDNVRTKEVYYSNIIENTTMNYKVRCNLNNDCFSNPAPNTDGSAAILIKKNPITLATITSDNAENKVCSAGSIVITGQCSSQSVFQWTFGTDATSANPYKLSPNATNPQNIDHIFKGKCIVDGCSTSETEIKIKEYSISGPTHFFPVRNPIEIGGEVEMIAMGCGRYNYKWSTGEAGSWDGAENSILKKTLREDAGFTVQCIKNGCVSAPSKNLWINVLSCANSYPKPTPVSVSNTNPIAGEEVILAVKGCLNDNYVFSNGITDRSLYSSEGGVNVYNYKAYPNETTYYTVKCKRDESCYSGVVGFAPVIVKSCVEGLQAPTSISSNKSLITIGETVRILAGGCGKTLKYNWSNGSLTEDDTNGASYIDVSPTETTSYRVRCQKDANCKSDFSGAVTVTVKTCAEGLQAPISINSDKSTIISGETVKITAYGCGTGIKYDWSNGSLTNDDTNGASYIDVSPTVTTTYKVRCYKDANCKSAWSGNVTVTVSIPTPCSTPAAPVITLSKTIISATEEILVSATCITGSVSWIAPTGYNGETRVTPGSTTTYKAKCRTSTTCESAEASSTATVNNCITAPNAPVITASALEVVAGGSVTVSATVCSTGSIIWSSSPTGFSSAGTHAINYNTTFKAVCKIDDSCISTVATKLVEVCNNPTMPTLTATNNNNSTHTLSGSCTTGDVVWASVGGIIPSPTSRTEYRAKCVLGVCESRENTVVIDPSCPTVAVPSITVSTANIYKNESVNVSATCASGTSVVWYSPENFEGGDHTPLVDTDYIAKCKNADNCLSDEDKKTVSVCVRPEEPVITSIQNANGSFTVTPSCEPNTSLKWILPANYHEASIVITSTTPVTAICQRNENCKSYEKTKEITITPCSSSPSVYAGDDVTICNGSSTTLNATGCVGGTITWNTAGGSLSVSPTITTTYTSTCTKDGCYKTDNVVVTVNALPSIEKTINCNDVILQLNVLVVKTNYNWYEVDIERPVGVRVKENSNFINLNKDYGGIRNLQHEYRVEDLSTGCRSAIFQTTRKVVGIPVPSISSTDQIICPGAKVTLTATGCGNNHKYLWNTFENTQSITFTGTNEGKYDLQVKCRNETNIYNICESEFSDPVEIEVKQVYTPTITGETTIPKCTQSIELKGTGCQRDNCYSWFKNDVIFSSSKNINVSEGGKYTLKCIDSDCIGEPVNHTVTKILPAPKEVKIYCLQSTLPASTIPTSDKVLFAYYLNDCPMQTQIEIGGYYSIYADENSIQLVSPNSTFFEYNYQTGTCGPYRN